MEVDVANECYICMKLGPGYSRDEDDSAVGRWLTKKGISKLISSSKERNDILHEIIDVSEKLWVTNTCYVRYTHNKNIASDNRGNLSAEGNPKANFVYEKYDRTAPYGYKTHCLVCERILDFEAMKKHPDRKKYKISSINIVDKKTGNSRKLLRR